MIRSGALLGLLFAVLNATAADITLLWDPSESPGVTSYKVYHTVSAHEWPTAWTAVANTTNLTFVHTNVHGGTHRWVLTAIGAYGVESEPSAEVSLALEAPAAPLQLSAKVGGRPGTTATLYRSRDLQSWERVFIWAELTNTPSFYRIELETAR